MCSSASLSTCLSAASCTIFATCSGFAAVCPTSRRYRLIAAQCICSRRGCLPRSISSVYSSTAVSNKCEQHRVYSEIGPVLHGTCSFFCIGCHSCHNCAVTCCPYPQKYGWAVSVFIAVSQWGTFIVNVSVCPLLISKTICPNFTKFSMHDACGAQSSDNKAIHYIHPVLWM